jgi:transcriptional regulator with XRE-family HTH domain
MSSESKVGGRIRMYRERLGMTVEALAAKSGMEPSVVKSVESGETLPALGALTKLSRALGQRLGTFMDDQFKPDPIVTRACDIEAAKVAGEGMNDHGYASHSLAIGKPDRHMDPFRIEFAADGVSEMSSHEGEELIICLAGEVELIYGKEPSTVLNPGDTAYYNSVVPHSLRALGGKPASIYGVVFMPF